MDISSECEENEGTHCETGHSADNEDGESDTDW